MAVLLALAPGTTQPQQKTGDKVAVTRTALAKYVETARIIEKEKRDWRLGKELLTERIAVVQREIDTLRAQIADADKSITNADKKKVELEQEGQRLDGAMASLGAAIDPLEVRTKTLLARLPAQLQEKLKRLSQRIPADPATTDLSLSRRFESVLGILNELNRFNREIELTSEMRQLPNGSTAEVDVFYVGLGQAYYVTTNGKEAGIGSDSSEGWVWTPVNVAAAEIAKAVAILKNEKGAEYVRLPIRIK